MLILTVGGTLIWGVTAQAVPEISVFPDSRVLAAAPETTVIVRGAPADELGDVTVTGSQTGEHSGTWEPHPDGDGAAFVPEQPFARGEEVTVDAGRGIAGIDSDETSFRIAGELDAPPPPFDDAPTPGDKGVHTFRSRPDLRPPAVRVETATPEAGDGKVFVAPKRGASRQGPLIVGADGEPVWFRPLPGDAQAFDFRVQTYEGEPVLTWWQGKVATYRGYGTGRILDTAYRPVKTVRMGNGYDVDAHEFELTDKGTALMISYYVVPWDLTDLGGRKDGLVEDNVVQEVDVETGAVLWEWHTLGTIPLGESIRPAPKEAGRQHDPWHLNSVALDADGDVIVSARHTSTIYKIDRETGDIVWRLGGKESDYALQPGAEFHLQHDARPRAEHTISLFDNVAEDLPARGRRSRGLVLQLDDEAMTASVKQEFKHEGTVLSGTQASMQRLEGGGAFVGWGGMQPWMTEFGPDGQTVWDARFLAPKVESYRAFRLPWTAARGEGRPAVAARAAGTGTDVWISWNGATEVAQWRVRPQGGPISTWPRDGFETAITLRRRVPALRVQALGAGGKVIGTSARVVVGGSG